MDWGVYYVDAEEIEKLRNQERGLKYNCCIEIPGRAGEEFNGRLLAGYRRGDGETRASKVVGGVLLDFCCLKERSIKEIAERVLSLRGQRIRLYDGCMEVGAIMLK